MSRPKRYDEAITKAAAKSIAPEVKRWLHDDTTLEQVETDLLKSMRYGGGDGYELAKSIERVGYNPDAELVEILDGVGIAKIRAHDAACREWVTANNIQPPAIGSWVTWPKCHEKNSGQGEVTRNNPEGTSTVCFAALGHIKEGLGTHGYVVAWEELMPA